VVLAAAVQLLRGSLRNSAVGIEAQSLPPGARRVRVWRHQGAVGISPQKLTPGPRWERVRGNQGARP
jgi:hypothetical protein